MFTFIANNSAFFMFVLFLSLFLYFKRKNLVISGSFPFLYMMMYKTSIGLDKMKKWSKSHSNVFLYLSYLSIFIGIVGMIAMFFFMFWQLGFIIDNHITSGGGLVLPLKTESGLEGAVPIIYVPFWYWIIALFVLVIVHEFAHGVIAERFNVKIKSSGFAFLGILAPILPAAFVEPDEKQLSKKPRWQQIAVFGAGSTSNFIFGAIFLLISLFVAAPFLSTTMQVDSITFSQVMNESDLKNYGVESGELLSVNNITNKEEIMVFLQTLDVNEQLNLTLNQSGIVNTYEISTFENPQIKDKAMIGISGIKQKTSNAPGYEWLGNFPLEFHTLLFYIWFLNIAIGMMNLLPIWITDGGQIAKSILTKYFKEKIALNVYNFISFLSLIIIIFTIWPFLLF